MMRRCEKIVTRKGVQCVCVDIMDLIIDWLMIILHEVGLLLCMSDEHVTTDGIWPGALGDIDSE